jgi:hypothetical protein
MAFATGLGVVAAFMLTVLGVWRLMGRPDGVESQLLALGGRSLEYQRHSGLAAFGRCLRRMADTPRSG